VLGAQYESVQSLSLNRFPTETLNRLAVPTFIGPADDVIQSKPVRLLCICSPAGQEKFFEEVGVRVASRTAAPPKLDEKQQEEFVEKALALAPKYRTEILSNRNENG
jgi:hypothetical protein